MVLGCWLALASAGVEDALLEARSAEREGEPVRERAACLEVMAQVSADEPAGYRCRGRLEQLEARQEPDGGLVGLTLLEQARRGEVEDLAPLRSHPSAVLRREAGLWESRQLPAEEGLALLEGLWLEVAEQPEAPLREELGQRYAELLIEAGRLEEAEAVEAAGASLPGRHEGVARARLLRRRKGLAWASGAALGLFLLAGVPAAWRARHLRPRLRGLIPLGLTVLLSAALAGAWEPAAGWRLLLALPGLALVHGLSAWALTGSHGAWKVALRGLAGLATLGVLGLVLSWREGWAWLGL